MSQLFYFLHMAKFNLIEGGKNLIDSPKQYENPQPCQQQHSSSYRRKTTEKITRKPQKLGGKKLNRNHSASQNYHTQRVCTVRSGSIPTASMAILKACIEGFSSTGNSSGRLDVDMFGFIVSKQMIFSKQSLIPKRSSAFIA